MGMKLNWIASGMEGTVGSHSQWLLTDVSPPFLAHRTVIPCENQAPTSMRVSIIYQDPYPIGIFFPNSLKSGILDDLFPEVVAVLENYIEKTQW